MKTENTTINMVDKLGTLNRAMAEMKKEADAIKAELKDYCNSNEIKKIAGSVYNVTYVEANRKVVDYKTLCSDMGVDSDTLGKYTTQTAVYSIKVS